MPGEAMHIKGAEGARRAKKWLDATTRVTQSWTNEDAVHARRLEFAWPHGQQSFSFDLGGTLSGAPYDGHFFLAEVKKYDAAHDQGTLYEDYLAKCYVARSVAQIADQFMWITWHPFSVTKWRSLCGVEYVKECVIKNHQRVFGTESQEEASEKFDQGLAEDVASRLWVIVLSDQQEELVISDAARAYLVSGQIKGEIKHG